MSLVYHHMGVQVLHLMSPLTSSVKSRHHKEMADPLTASYIFSNVSV